MSVSALTGHTSVMEAKILDFRIFRIFGKCGFWEFSHGIWGLGGFAIVWNSCGLQMDGFSDHFESSGSLLDCFHDFDDLAVVSGGLTMSRKVPGFSEGTLKVPGSCEGVLCDLSQQVQAGST